jgi:hypothetical protein
MGQNVLVSFHIYISMQYYERAQVKEDEMGRACSTNEGEDESI